MPHNNPFKTYIGLENEKALGGLISAGVNMTANAVKDYAKNPTKEKRIGAIAGTLGLPGMSGTVLGSKIGGLFEGDEEDPAIELNPEDYGKASTGSFEQGGALNNIAQNAFAFTGPSHNQGGIKLQGAEVEGGETMDFIEFQQGGKMMDKRDGSPYVFSKRLKVPGTNTSFADYHKMLVKNNANEKAVKKLAQVQEEVSGRTEGTATNPPSIPKESKSTEVEGSEEVGETNQKPKENPLTKSKAGGGKVKYEQGGEIDPDTKLPSEIEKSNESGINTLSRYLTAIQLKLKEGNLTKEQEKELRSEARGVNERLKRLEKEKKQRSQTGEKLEEVSSGLKEGNIERTRNMLEGNELAQGGEMEEYQTGGQIDPEDWTYQSEPAPYGEQLQNISEGLRRGNIDRTRRLMTGRPLQAEVTDTPLERSSFNYSTPSPVPTNYTPASGVGTRFSGNYLDPSTQGNQPEQGNNRAGVETAMFNPLQSQFRPSDLLRPGEQVRQPNRSTNQNNVSQQQSSPQRTQTQSSAQDTAELPEEGPETPLAEVSMYEPDMNMAETVSGPEGTEGMSAGDIATAPEGTFGEAGGAGGGSGWVNTALQFVPEAMNLAKGVFGDEDVPEPTQVSNRSVNKFPVNVDVSPQLSRNAASYRAILQNPNATINQKLAAQSQKQKSDAQILAQKQNRENQLRANRAKMQANIDRQNAQFRNQRRTEQMKTDAMFGPTGNMARQAVGSASQKLLMQQAMNNRAERDKQAMQALLQNMSPAVKRNFLNDAGLQNFGQ